jgi:hypothetical protein
MNSPPKLSFQNSVEEFEWELDFHEREDGEVDHGTPRMTYLREMSASNKKTAFAHREKKRYPSMGSAELSESRGNENIRQRDSACGRGIYQGDFAELSGLYQGGTNDRIDNTSSGFITTGMMKKRTIKLRPDSSLVLPDLPWRENLSRIRSLSV